MIVASLLSLLGAVGLLVHMAASWRARDCDCGKSRPPFLLKSHTPLRPLLLSAFSMTMVAAGCFINADGPYTSLMTAVLTLFSTMDWLGIYHHEKDKLKKAAKALGKVFIMDNGKLGVSPA